MSFLYFLENLRNPVLDLLFSAVTLFGEETVFMAIGMIVFWCVSKQKGYYWQEKDEGNSRTASDVRLSRYGIVDNAFVEYWTVFWR